MKRVDSMSIVAVLAFGAAVAACSGSSESLLSKGIILDATMNTLVLQDMATGDTLVVSTMDAEHVGNGILLGDVAEVTYTDASKEHIRVASKVEILSDSREDSPLVGEWVEPNPIDPTSWQGFSLDRGGAASSIGMATLQYVTWTPWNGKLILMGQSIGNGQTIDFTEIYDVVSVSADKLVLQLEGNTFNYIRKPLTE